MVSAIIVARVAGARVGIGGVGSFPIGCQTSHREAAPTPGEKATGSNMFRDWAMLIWYPNG